MKKPALERLDAMIGLSRVKQEIRELVQLVKYQQMCEKNHIFAPSVSMHMVFTGNPGTGKTTVAKLLGEIYHEIGLLPNSKVVEADRGDLVGVYLGETAVKTKKVIDKALGGILFIDEAYTLAEGPAGDYGQEAIDTLLKAMEDHRGNLAVIVAGYTDRMQNFIRSNPGLQSRFTRTIHFEDYGAEEMEKIFYLFARNYCFTEEAAKRLHELFWEMDRNRGPNFGNGRAVRNFYEILIKKMAFRLVSSGCTVPEDLTRVTLEDVETAIREMKAEASAGAGKNGPVGFSC